ncbi:SusC/RagA family TonB-linked outer membrane protein [Leeuwenhoekiella parthenopeia]|uniref:TonB-dependent receptor n=1 Tax=Leeuwenhoekiella parthenopeia TaxID=2890320 RepID=A0ABS8GVE4_9FLAO|nr:TonB-dependent receptor [Leeuwenhoekiella parthenopeia]MCC4213776.1 TonB-dependent receptor [Leeuwenhoekiella parthenopeia]
MRSILSLMVLVLFSSGLFAQTGDPIQASGTVTDMTGMPLPGVNVIVKGTSRGTSTNFDGEFSLSVLQSGTLVFSYLGFQPKEVTVTSTNPITVQLVEDASALEEVVVIGYGTQTRKEVTGAVAVVGSETIEEQNPVRIEQALQGRVAGVNISSTSGSPGSASTINIRGISTNGDNRPLILVDGAVIEDLSVLNPNDIESINVLKDATAGIYGVRAANGVILITTKTGRKNTDLRVNVDSYVGVQETTRKLPVLNATEYGAIINEAFVAGNQAPPFPNLRNLGMGTDWQDEVFRKAFLSDVNATIYAGGENSTYSIGLGYLDQDGIVGGGAANFERFTGRGSYNLDITDNLKFKASGIYTNSNRSTLLENTLGSVLFNAVNMDPTRPVRDANGDFTLATGLGNEVINPVAQIANTFNGTQVDKITGTVGLSYGFLDNFKIESNYQFNYSEVRNRAFNPSGLNYGDGKVFNNLGRNEYFVNDSFFRDYTWDNLLTYTNTIADDHNITALLGMSAFRTSGEFYNFTGRGVPGNTFAEASLVGAEEVIDARTVSGGPNEFDQRLLSYFTRLQYNFKEKYLFSALLRRDGSSNFGPENKFGYFYALSGGWVLSDEDFFDSEFINFAKLRGSYGLLGNDRIGAFGFVSTLNGEGTYVFDDELVFGVAPGQLSNPEIKWERQKTYDIGVDLELFSSAIRITADYFNKRTEDLLLVPQVSGLLGVTAPGSSPPIVNAGSVENRGFEFSINYNQIISDDADFNIGYNFTTLKNEVLQVGNQSGFIPGGSFGFGQEAPARMEAGFPIGYFYGLQTNGIFQTQAEVDAHATQANAVPGDLRYVDQNGDGVIDGDDRVNIGDPIPDVTMGLNIGFNYKNFDFTAYAYASIGNDIVRAYDRNQNLTNKTNYVLNRWIGAGSTDTYPRVTIGPNSNLLFSDFYVEDGSYLRLQNVQVGYSLGNDVIEQLGISKLRFYVAVANAFTLTKYQGFDPSASSGAPIGGGIDQGFYPVPRIYTAGLNFKF